MPTQENIWVAASDGDLARVTELVEQQGISPNAFDSNTYSPMHAAASYGHLHILDYLISLGGDINLVDADGDTPLYCVENIETAKYLVDHGAVVERRNHEGVSPIEWISNDFPEVGDYLRSMSTATDNSSSLPATQTQLSDPSQHHQNVVAENLTTDLMTSVHDIMTRSEAEGWDPDAELRRVVGQTVFEGLASGYAITTLQGGENERGGDEPDSKRARTG
jgi:hypothetical protein